MGVTGGLGAQGRLGRIPEHTVPMAMHTGNQTRHNLMWAPRQRGAEE